MKNGTLWDFFFSFLHIMQWRNWRFSLKIDSVWQQKSQISAFFEFIVAAYIYRMNYRGEASLLLLYTTCARQQQYPSSSGSKLVTFSELNIVEKIFFFCFSFEMSFFRLFSRVKNCMIHVDRKTRRFGSENFNFNCHNL